MFGLKKSFSVHKGFGLTLGITLFYLGLMLIIPLSTLFFKTFSLTWDSFWTTVTDERVMKAYQVSFGTAFLAAGVNLIFGTLIAWVLVRYQFFGKRILDALIDFPFALPTAVAGICLTTLFASSGWIGNLLDGFGIQVVFTQWGITIALIFITLPFSVRSIQPVLEDLNPEVEEAAISLGANRWQLFSRIIVPELLPAAFAGFTLSFARALGEYGSVVFISGNLPFKTEIAPLLIVTKLEQYDYAGATSIAVVLLIFSFITLIILNSLQSLNRTWKSRN